MSKKGDLQDGRIDPDKLDAAAKPKRRRRKRNRPEPAEELREWEKDAEARALARPYPPGIILEPAGFDQEHWTAPHNDDSLWSLQLADAFGTRSRAVFITFMRQLEQLCSDNIWDDEAKQWRLDENQFSAALAIVNSTKPRNELEACLAAQMVATHVLTMKVSARAIKYDCDTRTAATAAKLARAFAGQLETLRSIRGEQKVSRQSISVSKETHQHIHYHDHRGEGENDGQPHGRNTDQPAQIADGGKALRSQDKGRNVLPMPRDAGKG